MAGLEAEKRASRKIEVKDVEAVCEDGKKVFPRKSLLALNSIERALLKIIYSSDELTSGQLFKVFREFVHISYARFYESLMKLENLKLIDMKYDSGKRGRTRLIIKRYEPKLILDALKEF